MIQKVYYTIPEIAKQLGIAPSHVRHYVKEFDIPAIGERWRTKRIHVDDVELLKKIHYEVAVEGRHYWKIKEIIAKKLHYSNFV